MTTILRLQSCNTLLQAEHALLVERILEKGGVVLFPTDTVYGIGGNPKVESVVEKVLKVKARAKRELPLLACSMEEVLSIVRANEVAVELMKSFWPGPLTLVLPSTDAKLESLVGRGGKIGVRGGV